jgi:hypothetical protein
MKYYFLHPVSLKVCVIKNGRSTWEDHINKAEFIVVKEVGPAMEYCELATSQKVDKICMLKTILSTYENVMYPSHAKQISDLINDLENENP